MQQIQPTSKYRKRPVVIEACQHLGEEPLFIDTLEAGCEQTSVTGLRQALGQ